MLYAAVTLLLGITVLAEAATIKKISDTQRKVADELRLTLSTQYQDIADLKQKNRELQGEICDLRGEVSCREPHTPLKDENFIYGGYNQIKIGNGKTVNEDFLKYEAAVALKVISAELPEDVRTYATVGKIVKYMFAQLEEQKISTKI